MLGYRTQSSFTPAAPYWQKLAGFLAISHGKTLPTQKMSPCPPTQMPSATAAPEFPVVLGAPLFCCPRRQRPGQAELTSACAVAVPGDGEVPRAGSLTSLTSITLPHALPFLLP